MIEFDSVLQNRLLCLPFPFLSPPLEVRYESRCCSRPRLRVFCSWNRDACVERIYLLRPWEEKVVPVLAYEGDWDRDDWCGPDGASVGQVLHSWMLKLMESSFDGDLV